MGKVMIKKITQEKVDSYLSNYFTKFWIIMLINQVSYAEVNITPIINLYKER